MAFCLLGSTVTSQENTFFNSVLNSKLPIEEKQVYLDSLLSSYESKEIDSLPHILNSYAYTLFDFGETKRAIDLNYKALNLAQQDSVIDKRLFQLIQYDLGFYLRKSNENIQSIEHYIEAIAADKTSDISIIGLYDLGLVYTRLGDFHRAIDNYEASILQLQKLTYNKSILRSAYQNVSYLSFQIQTTESLKKGIIYALKADSLAQKIRTSDKTNYEIKYNLASLHGEKQYLDTLKAKAYYTDAFIYADELNSNRLKARVYHGLGDLYNILNTSRSLNYFNKALNLLDVNDTLLKSDLYNGIGHAYRIDRKFQQSLAYRHKALELLVGDNMKDFDSNLEVQKHKEYLFHFLVQLAETYLATHNEGVQQENNDLLNKSLKYFRIADGLVDDLRSDSQSFKSRLFWRKISANLYSKAIETCFLLNNQEEAFYFMEKNKGLLLLEDINNHKYEFLKVDSLLSTKKIGDLPLSKSLKEAQSNLKKDEVIVIYHIPTDIDYSLEDDTNKGYLLGFTNKTIFFEELPNIELLEKNIIALFELLRRPFATLKDSKDYAVLSFQIYQSLFPNKKIQSILVNNKVKIIPDDFLSILPFEALSYSKAESNFLIQNCEISYAHSIALLNNLKHNTIFNTEGYIGFAPIKFEQLNLNPLVESKKEVDNLFSYFRGKPFFNKKATKKEFLKIEEKQTIIHLATHADAEGNTPPWIGFADSKAYLDEIYESDIAANLVVLSGCNTGFGINEPGEGIMNLARAFFYNGSNSVISSLWNIDDTSTSEIISSFYRYLSKGKTKSESLLLSKRDYIKNHIGTSEVSPYYWSSLVLWGDSATLPTSSFWDNYMVLYIAIFFLTLLLLYSYLRKRRLF